MHCSFCTRNTNAKLRGSQTLDHSLAFRPRSVIALPYSRDTQLRCEEPKACRGESDRETVLCVRSLVFRLPGFQRDASRIQELHLAPQTARRVLSVSISHSGPPWDAPFTKPGARRNPTRAQIRRLSNARRILRYSQNRTTPHFLNKTNVFQNAFKCTFGHLHEYAEVFLRIRRILCGGEGTRFKKRHAHATPSARRPESQRTRL